MLSYKIIDDKNTHHIKLFLTFGVCFERKKSMILKKIKKGEEN